MKKKIAGIIICCCIAAAGIAGYFMYQKKAEQVAIDEQFNQIYAIGTEFSAAESREEQLNVLKNVLTEREAYIKDKKHSEEVADKYDSVILGMQGVFVKAYDSEIVDSTLENLDEEEDQSTNGILCKKYVFDYHPDKENYGGLAEVYVIDMSDDSIPESVYDKMYPDYASEVGTTSFGAYHIFMLQVGGDFFGESNDHATLTVK